MKPRFAIIDWTDAAVHGNDEHSPDDLGLNPVRMTSIGFVVKDMTRYITLAMDDFHDGTYRSCETIPKSGITKIEYLKVK